MDTVRWIGIGVGALFATTIVMLVRSASGSGGGGGGGGGTASPEDEALTPEWEDDDFRALAAVAKKNRMNPADLLLVLASESGLHPWAAYRVDEDGNATTDKSGYPYAAGINQVTKAANDVLGITEAERATIPTWSVAEEIPLVDKLFRAISWTKTGKPYAHAGVIYAANFAPARMSEDVNAVLYRQGVDGAAYTRNRGFDVAVKGYITVGDLVEHLRGVAMGPVYQSALRRLQAATGDAGLAPRLPAG